MGRLPIHFAACQYIDNFKIIVETGGDLTARDRMQRTALHWAAQHGSLRVVQHILWALGSKAVDEGDIGGWTPLCWAARGTNDSTAGIIPKAEAEQEQVIRLLLNYGADCSVQGSIGEERWSPRRISQYSGANAEIIGLLRGGPGGKGSNDTIDAAIYDLNEHAKAAHAHAWYCESCLWMIRGFLYRCTICDNFGLCNKCFARREGLRADHPDHSFDKIGPEFDPEEPADDIVGSGDGNTTESDDSDSSSESETSDS
ncbi:hypothetical protein EV356DRAFT_530139 [Viridothelium virens]|uniref:protein S-acyltransferase n=1 Tax=Viridothelium virens TaxID=1048519 RepID=A0A6A6HH97_VIRVR|nr:hypothetical protein EV356DRAFT_530139 [Viridothelium virens]